MKLFPIPDPLAGEKVAEVIPVLAPFVESGERIARLNFFPGRHLTHTALAAEQAVRVRRLLFRGRSVCPGNVEGLEVSWTSEPGGDRLRIQPGRGITVSGEDVVLERPVVMRSDDLRIFPSSTTTWNDIPKLASKTVGAPFAAVLVLKPMALTVRKRPYALNPALDPHPPGFVDRVPEDETFDRLSMIDAVCPVLWLWEGSPAFGSQWRNRLAWQIFGDERDGLSQPWLQDGLPVALVGFDASRKVLFVDRHAVVRRGGIPRTRSILPHTGDPRLWQAQVDQYGDHLASLDAIRSALGDFQQLPSVGLLRRDSIQIAPLASNATARTVTQSFFPPTYKTDVGVCLLEQLDTVFSAARTLQPYDLYVPDSVSILLPVEQRFFDPKLLDVEQPNPEFQTQLVALGAARDAWLGRRADLRQKYAALTWELTGQGLPIDFGTDSLDGEPASANDPDPREQPYGTEQASNPPAVAVAAITLLRRDLLQTFKFSTQEITYLKSTIPQYCGKQVDIQEDETTNVTKVGLKSFIDYLEEKVDRADALVDRGFLSVNANVYRLGQLLNNNAVGTRFATSESLSTLVTRQSAAATPATVNSFSARLFADLAVAGKPAPSNTLVAGAFDKPQRAAAPAAATTGTINQAVISATSARPSLQIFEGVKAFAKVDEASLLKLTESVSPDSEEGKTLKTLIEAKTLQAEDLKQLENLAAFAEAYSPNLNQVTTKQIRAIPLERLPPPDAPKARKDLFANKLDIFDRLMQLDISLAGLTTDFVDVPPTPTPLANNESKAARILTFHELIQGRDVDSLSPEDSDEAQQFSRAVKHADMSLSALRAVEARIGEYRRLIARCRDVLAEVAGHAARLQARWSVVTEELAEARQDVAVAQALLEEEKARVAAINARRAQILENHVSFAVFHRARAVDARVETPTRVLEATLREEPVPRCLSEDVAVPPDMAALWEAFRLSPAHWFRLSPRWLAEVDRLEHLREMLQRSSERLVATTGWARVVTPGRFSNGLQRVLTSRLATSERHLAAIRLMPPVAIATLNWSALLGRAKEVLTVGHLMDFGSSKLTQAASREIHGLFKVAACLHRDFCKVAPILRLVWAERYSTFDGPADFRDLARLPRWSEVPFALRREMQLHVGWLFSKMDVSQAPAVDLMNDLVRAALLLASHAPVSQPITGTLAEDSTPSPGGLMPILIDPARIRVGMKAIIEQTSSSPKVRVLGVVEDLSPTRAIVRVTVIEPSPAAASSPQLTIAATSVRLMEPEALAWR
jgi:hypothetical protein